MLLPNRHQNTGDYRYGFNGKELDNEIKGEGLQIDYGFRIYDPRLGKFLSEDPLTASYPWYTPYQFAGNSPLMFIDLDGLERHWYVYDDLAKKGTTKITFEKDDYGFLWPLGGEDWSIYKKKLVTNGGFWQNKVEWKYDKGIVFKSEENFQLAREAIEEGIMTFDEISKIKSNDSFKEFISIALLDLHDGVDDGMASLIVLQARKKAVNALKQTIKGKASAQQKTITGEIKTSVNSSNKSIVKPGGSSKNIKSTVQTLKSTRDQAVRKAWKQEKALIEITGRGTRNWTKVEMEAIKASKTGRISGYQGHHINNVNSSPNLAGNPNNIKFVKAKGEHLSEHGGNFRNNTSGSLFNREVPFPFIQKQ